jgi:uncharacterized protein
MSFSGTYPGVYVQELPSTVHNVSAATTSVTAFVGYTHPFLTTTFDAPVHISSISDYVNNFGGFFSSPWQPDYVGQAVNEFFTNGGSSAYVVGLQPREYWSGSPATAQGEVGSAHVATSDGGITFLAVQPVGVPASGTSLAAGTPMQVTISNLQGTDDAVADVVVTYGTMVETYRAVNIAALVETLAGSALVRAQLASPAPTAYTAQTLQLAYTTPPQLDWTVISPADFAPVFLDNAPLDKISDFNLLVIPGITNAGVMSQAVAYCERKRAFLIMDPPSSWDVDTLTGGGALALDPAPPISPNAALYFPWLQTTDPVTQGPTTAPPSGFVAGVYAAEDATRGVWKSPAGIETSLLGTIGVAANGVMTDAQAGILNAGGVNCLRDFAGSGTVVFGARTVASTDAAYEQWKYVAVRRMALFLEQSLYQSLTWAVFEPNAAPLWQALTQEVSAFMLSLFRQGAFAGTKPSDSFLVVCDQTTTTASDVSAGVVNVLVGFAPLEPAEFVVIQIAQLAGQASS